MILIFSEAYELSTDKVCLWLKHMKKQFVRINDTEKIRLEILDVGLNENVNFKIQHNGKLYASNDIKSVWFRRGYLKLDFPVSLNDLKDKGLISNLNEFFYSEKKTIADAIIFELLKKKHINKISDYEINKIITLNLAHNVGLKIPSTQIICKKSDIKDERIITKTIGSFSDIYGEKKKWNLYTEMISNQSVISDSFSPSLIQTNVDKAFEIRTFYFNKNFFSMAIFSQNDEQTKVDFRKYNLEKPNRVTPFKLPFEIESKLRVLIDKTGINSGSIDFIRGTDGEYYFLEINPVGQFDMVSHPCNYFIEKKIAKYL